ncbi:hypothetical protein NC652_023306 [Populus alba x Populus x berolinensis]|nr:hypothetical protein NC652_023306 [Populus alba x Populus x berolinensis]
MALIGFHYSIVSPDQVTTSGVTVSTTPGIFVLPQDRKYASVSRRYSLSDLPHDRPQCSENTGRDYSSFSKFCNPRDYELSRGSPGRLAYPTDAEAGKRRSHGQLSKSAPS